jgi:hypothetical protein
VCGLVCVDWCVWAFPKVLWVWACGGVCRATVLRLSRVGILASLALQGPQPLVDFKTQWLGALELCFFFFFFFFF